MVTRAAKPISTTLLNLQRTTNNSNLVTRSLIGKEKLGESLQGFCEVYYQSLLHKVVGLHLELDSDWVCFPKEIDGVLTVVFGHLPS